MMAKVHPQAVSASSTSLPLSDGSSDFCFSVSNSLAIILVMSNESIGSSSLTSPISLGRIDVASATPSAVLVLQVNDYFPIHKNRACNRHGSACNGKLVLSCYEWSAIV
ncbi:uncharacterized protein METZ01_LOCUS314064 [marine metagenome]|uniref:Uncharacterized protein n=1 Tax=marine metagenome TaxID=408172 RepID=A0A382NKM2_9ZZZZ